VGWIYYKMGVYDEARYYIEKAARIRGDSSVLMDHLGDVYEKLNMMNEARDAWKKALELDADNESIKKKLDQGVEN
jgi:tetratricopeptide (TPR) repeat protein